MRLVAAEQPALIILELMLPDLDGIEICRRIRKTSDVPILMLTARDEDVDKIIGLRVNDDDEARGLDVSLHGEVAYQTTDLPAARTH